jgi:hypothetical protein
MIFQAQAKDGLGSVMMVSGTQPIPISNHALDRQLSNYIAANQMSDCRAFLVRENSMIFYRMNFTAANHTWVYNVTLSDPSRDETKKWHEEETLAGNRHPAQTIAYFNGQNYVGDYANPIMYILDPNTYTNNGENIKRMRISRSFVPPGYNRIRVDRFHLDLLQGNIAEANDFISDINLLAENGDPILTEDGINIILDQQFIIADPMIPFVFFSASKDGGQTYKYTVKSPMGAIGNRTARTVWRKLGATKRGQPFLTKIEFYAAIPYIILGAAWSFEVLPQ